MNNVSVELNPHDQAIIDRAIKMLKHDMHKDDATWGVYSMEDDSLWYSSKSYEDVEIWQSEHRIEHLTYIAEVTDNEQ